MTKAQQLTLARYYRIAYPRVHSFLQLRRSVKISGQIAVLQHAGHCIAIAECGRVL